MKHLRRRRLRWNWEDGICAASRTGKPVVDDKNDKVNISEQGHGGWNGIGDDISGEWQ